MIALVLAVIFGWLLMVGLGTEEAQDDTGAPAYEPVVATAPV